MRIPNTFIFILSMMALSPVQSQWVRLQSGTDENLTDVQFLNDQTGFILGNHVVLKTEDGGVTFRDITPEPGVELRAMQFLNSETGFILSDQSVIYRTVDGGDTYTNNLCVNWISNIIPTNDIYFSDALNGSCEAGGYFYYTHDGGITWPDNAYNFNYDLRTDGEINLFIDGPLFYRTEYELSYSFFTSDIFLYNTDWIQIADDLDYQTISAVAAWKDSVVCYLTLENSDLYFYDYHQNAGYYQLLSVLPGSHLFNDMYFKSDDAGFICGRKNDDGYVIKGAEILSSADGGEEWKTDLVDPHTYQFNKMSFPDKETGYVVGSSGVIWKWSDPENSSAAHLVSIYPNPATNWITFAFSPGYSADSYLQFYNILGVPLFPDISYNIQGALINSDQLLSGIYFYQLIRYGEVLDSDEFSVI